jgi:hypothetical protein
MIRRRTNKSYQLCLREKPVRLTVAEEAILAAAIKDPGRRITVPVGGVGARFRQRPSM